MKWLPCRSLLFLFAVPAVVAGFNTRHTLIGLCYLRCGCNFKCFLLYQLVALHLFAFCSCTQTHALTQKERESELDECVLHFRIRFVRQLLRSREVIYFICHCRCGCCCYWCCSYCCCSFAKIKEEIEFVAKIYVFEWKCCLPLLRQFPEGPARAPSDNCLSL